MDPITLYFTGTAGAGKTSLTSAMKAWMEEQGYSTATVNLDPGMEDPSFTPDVDVREWVKLEEVMAESNLGPNGAQIAASDLVAVHISSVRDALESLHADYVLVDTPGQVELFAFRESSKAILEELGGDRSMIAFLFDPMLARFPSGFVSLILLSATVQFRFGLPMMNVLSKTDLLQPVEKENLARWGESRDALAEAISATSFKSDGMVTTEFFRALEIIEPNWVLLPTSAREEEGLTDLYAAVQQAFLGGEELDKDSGKPGESL